MITRIRIENNSDEWVAISEVTFSFGDQLIDKKINLLVGDRLLAWHDSVTHQVNKENEIAAAIFTGIGALIGAAHSNSSQQGFAAGVGAIGLTLAASSNIQKLGVSVPRDHILSLPFYLPPQLPTIKWVVFDTTNDQSIPLLEFLEINLISSTGKKFSGKANLYAEKGSCLWQDDLRECDPLDKMCF